MSPRSIVVTGAASGIGRAVAVGAARDGWFVRRTHVVRHARVQSLRLEQGPLERRLGTIAGVVKAVVQDRSAKEPGLLRVLVKGKGGVLTLPDAALTRTTVVLGTPGECAAQRWNGPGEARPRCDGDASRLTCK